MSIKINLGIDVRVFGNSNTIENIPLEYFKDNLLIWGKDRLERTALLSHISNQFHTSFPDIGVLLIRVESSKDSNLFYFDRKYSYGDLELEIPYFLENEIDEGNREQFEDFINAIFNFHFEMRIVIGCVLQHYKAGEFPSSIVDFLEEVKVYLKNNPYSEEFTSSNIRSVERAIETFSDDPALERALWIPLRLPEWLRLWREGKSICIDLSECDLYFQKLLVAMLLQVIKNHTPVKNSDIHIGVVAIEDVDNIFQKPPHEEYRRYYGESHEYWDELREENYFLTKEQIEEAYGDKVYLSNVQFERVISRIVFDALQYKNISLINVCQEPMRIYRDIVLKSQIKIPLDSP